MFAIALPGVLQKHNEAPNPQGIALYHALAAVGRVAVLCGTDRDRAEWFLKTNGLTDHVDLVPEAVDSAPDVVGRRKAQVGSLRSSGSHVEFLIDADPEVIAALYEDGVPGLLYLHPQYSQPSFRPDYASVAKPWDTLVAAVDYQMQVRANHKIPVVEEVEED